MPVPHRRTRNRHRDRQLGWWIAILFMIGSACFALGSFPGISSVLPSSVIGPIFFIGSIFFTSAGYCQYFQSINSHGSRAVVELEDDRTIEEPGTPDEHYKTLFVAWQPLLPDWWSSGIQSIGTLWFNVNTFNAMRVGLTVTQQNLRIWTPDFVGSICFLVASQIPLWVMCRKPMCVRRGDTDWWIASINMVGSIFFMASALAAFVLPSTGDFVDANLANTGTFLGALCFFWAARLVLKTLPDASAARSPSAP